MKVALARVVRNADRVVRNGDENTVGVVDTSMRVVRRIRRRIVVVVQIRGRQGVEACVGLDRLGKGNGRARRPRW